MRLIILGTGGMARAHAEHFGKINGVELVAGVDVVPENLNAFCEAFDIPRQFGSIEEALDWGEFDAVANVTPDAIHHKTSMAALKAGKHVFCEKPLATNYADALEMAETAEKAGLINMVNLTYRNVAQIQQMRKLIRHGDIGNIRHIEASYLQSWLVSNAWGEWDKEPKWLWRLSKKHGSNGTLGDVGIHILDFAVHGSTLDIENVFCRLQTFHKAPGDKIGEYVLDANDSFTMSVEFTGGVLGVVHSTRFATGHLNDLRLRVYGDKGGLEVVHKPDGSVLRACTEPWLDTATWHEVPAPAVETNYQKFAKAVAAETNDQPNFRHAANLQRVLDTAMVSDSERKEIALGD